MLNSLGAACLLSVWLVCLFYLFFYCSPEGNSASPPTLQTAVTTSTPKWPLKPGVLVHMKGARLQGTNSMGALQTSTPMQGVTPVRGRSNRRIWVLQRRRALSLNSLAQADDSSQRSRARRIRKMFSSSDSSRSDALPSGVSRGASGGRDFLFAFCFVCL